VNETTGLHRPTTACEGCRALFALHLAYEDDLVNPVTGEVDLGELDRNPVAFDVAMEHWIAETELVDHSPVAPRRRPRSWLGPKDRPNGRARRLH